MMKKNITIYHLKIEDLTQFFRTYCSPNDLMDAYEHSIYNIRIENIALPLKKFLKKYNNRIEDFNARFCNNCKKYISSCKYCINYQNKILIKSFKIIND